MLTLDEKDARFRDALEAAFKAAPNGEQPAFSIAWHTTYDNWLPPCDSPRVAEA